MRRPPFGRAPPPGAPPRPSAPSSSCYSSSPPLARPEPASAAGPARPAASFPGLCPAAGGASAVSAVGGAALPGAERAPLLPGGGPGPSPPPGPPRGRRAGGRGVRVGARQGGGDAPGHRRCCCCCCRRRRRPETSGRERSVGKCRRGGRNRPRAEPGPAGREVRSWEPALQGTGGAGARAVLSRSCRGGGDPDFILLFPEPSSRRILFRCNAGGVLSPRSSREGYGTAWLCALVDPVVLHRLSSAEVRYFEVSFGN